MLGTVDVMDLSQVEHERRMVEAERMYQDVLGREARLAQARDHLTALSIREYLLNGGVTGGVLPALMLP